MIVADRARRLPATASATPSLTAGARVDVCILGAGLAGMIAAYLLGRAGRQVMVLEEGPLGGLQGGFEAAHLASAVERPYALIESTQGRDAARVAAQSAAAAVDALEAIVLRERIACEFERLDGYSMAADGDAWAGLEHEAQAARRAGIQGVELIDAPPVGGAAWKRCLRYPAQAHFHPTRFLEGLARAMQRAGGRIHCGIRCQRIESGPPVAVVTSAGHRIEAQTLVASEPMRGGIAAPVAAPRMAHMVGLRVPRGSVPRALYWESSQPVRWMRLRSQGSGAGEVLLAGSEDPPGDDDHTAYRYLALEAWARSRFPQAREIVQRFTGEIVQTPDLFAVSSRGDCDSQSVYLATGGWGTPMTRGTLAGLVIRDFVEGGELPWADLYLPEACYVPREAARAL
jgi:glycine/D-amino acid oxidase-like deaminating enzyme